MKERDREEIFMRIGLMGFGVVGRGVYEIVSKRQDMEVAKVLCLEEIQLSRGEAVKSFDEILNDDTIDTVVEAKKFRNFQLAEN